MGLHFVFAGAAQDEPGVFVTFQENRPQLARVMGRFGWNIEDPNVTIMDRSPVDLYVDELVYELLDEIHEADARRLVVDSLNDLIVATPDPLRLREFLYSLVQRCARLGVSLMFTYETAELFRITRLSELGMSHIADNVVLLQHVQDGSQMRRALTVLKSRGSMNSAVISEFTISTEGITLGEPLDLRDSGAEPSPRTHRHTPTCPCWPWTAAYSARAADRRESALYGGPPTSGPTPVGPDHSGSGRRLRHAADGSFVASAGDRQRDLLAQGLLPVRLVIGVVVVSDVALFRVEVGS